MTTIEKCIIAELLILLQCQISNDYLNYNFERILYSKLLTPPYKCNLWTSLMNKPLKKNKKQCWTRKKIILLTSLAYSLIFRLFPTSYIWSTQRRINTRPNNYFFIYYFYFIFFSSSLSWKLCLMVWRLKQNYYFNVFFMCYFFGIPQNTVKKWLLIWKSCF